VLAILRSLRIDGERLGDALDDAAWGALMVDDTEQAVRLAEEKWRYPRRPRSHRYDGWLSQEIDLEFVRVGAGSPGADAGPVIGALEAILEDVDRSDQALFAAHLRYTISAFLGNGDRAFRHERDALRRYRDLGHRGQVPIGLLGIAADELRLGRPDRALRLAAAAGRESEALGGTVARDWSEAHTDLEAAALLPADEVARGLREGAAMSVDEAMAYALDELPEDAGGKAPHRGRHDLTAREHEVLALVADGRTDGEIADALVISKKTASVHVASIKSKLGAGSRGEIVSMALRGALVDEA
jgi:DNA-binding CsgD family transcriptional regulator